MGNRNISKPISQSNAISEVADEAQSPNWCDTGATGRRQLYTDIITRDLASLNQRSLDHFLMNAFVSASASLLPSSIDDRLDMAFSY